jgi:type IV pilus assembly protein PilA
MATRTSQGFTLIELMIVVAIVGMLVSLSVPVYQDYSARSKLAEVISLSKTDRTLAAAYFSETSNLPDSLESLGIDTSADRSRYLVGDLSATVDAGEDSFSITYPVGNLGGSSVPGTLVWKGTAVDAVMQWDCTGGTLPHRYRPPSCRP